MTAPGFENNKLLGSLTAGADLAICRFVTVAASDNVGYTGAAGRVDGVTYLPVEEDQPVTIAVDGIVVIEAGGTFSDGDSLISAANGRAVVSDDINCYAVALEDATVGAHVRALLMPKNTDLGGHGIEIITATPGAVSVTKKVTLIAPDGTDAHTIADGSYDGMVKFVKCAGGANTPIVVLTGAFDLNGTAGNTLTMDSGEYAWMAYDLATDKWYILHTTGALTTV